MNSGYMNQANDEVLKTVTWKRNVKLINQGRGVDDGVPSSPVFGQESESESLI